MFKWWDPVYSWYRWPFKKMLLFTNTISNCPIETTSSKCLWGQAALLLVGCTIVVEIQFRLLSKNLRPGFDDSSYNGESFTIRAGSSDRHVVLYLWVFCHSLIFIHRYWNSLNLFTAGTLSLKVLSPRHVDLSAEDDFEDFDEAIQSYSCSCRN